MARAPAAKVRGPGFDSWWLPWVFFSLPAGLVLNGKVYGALVQFGCYQHSLCCSSTVQLLLTQT